MRVIGAVCILAVLLPAFQAKAGLWNWFRFGVTDYEIGQSLTDAGAKRGTWGEQPVPEGATAIAEEIEGRKVLSIDASDPLVFEALRSSGDKAYSTYSDLTVRFSHEEVEEGEVWEPPTLEPDTRAAIVIGRTEAGGLAFYGYTAEGWLELSGVEAEYDVWYDLRACFYPTETGLDVVYSAKTGDRFVPLSLPSGVSRFACAGEGQTWKKVSFGGTGAVEKFGANNGACRISFE